jgi:hypothetical protein
MATAAPTAQAKPPQTGIMPLVGAWHLASLEQPGPDGTLHKMQCPGLMTFTADGHMAVQLMLPTGTSNAYAHGGYEASFGHITLAPGQQSFTLHVDGALVRDLVGKDLPRAFRVTGTTLVISSTRPDEHWRAVWKRD